MDATDLQAEQNALRFALKLPAEPVCLDIKPGPLTAGERRRFAERLATVTVELESEPVLWWERWRRGPN